jgi:hypothetical protein
MGAPVMPIRLYTETQHNQQIKEQGELVLLCPQSPLAGLFAIKSVNLHPNSRHLRQGLHRITTLVRYRGTLICLAKKLNWMGIF